LTKEGNSPSNPPSTIKMLSKTQTTVKYKTSSVWHLKWIHRTDKELFTKMSKTTHIQNSKKPSLSMHPVSHNHTQPSIYDLGPSALIKWTNTRTYPSSREFWYLLKNNDLTMILNQIWPDIKGNNQNKYQQKIFVFYFEFIRALLWLKLRNWWHKKSINNDSTFLRNLTITSLAIQEMNFAHMYHHFKYHKHIWNFVNCDKHETFLTTFRRENQFQYKPLLHETNQQSVIHALILIKKRKNWRKF
jgi:hypothetical protein